MNLQSCKRIAYGRCETPENTVARLETLLGAHYDYRLMEEKVAEHLHWSALFIDDLDFRAMGKGISAVLSKAGALAESAEWLAARAVTSLPGYTAAHQDELDDPLALESLLSHVESATPSVLTRIKRLDCAQHWVDGFSLVSKGRVKVPIEYVRLISGPNGLAAGNRVEEALVHALNEIFERRAHITVLRNRMVMPTIDPDTITDPVIRGQLKFVQDRGIEVTLKDLSFDGALPCLGAYFRDPSIPADYQFHHFFKVGASFDHEQALTRAFTEYVQGRRLDEFIRARREEQDRVLQHDFRNLKCFGEEGDNFLSAFMFGFVPYQRADFLAAGEVVPFDPGTPSDDCLADIRRALSIFRKLELDCVVVDFTDPDIGFPVIEAVVPGYSDVLPYHPRSSPVLFRRWTRNDVLNSYQRG